MPFLIFSYNPPQLQSTMNKNTLRNIAIIAHVDHGKTTLVDKLLQQSGTLDRKSMTTERIMDSNDQEKERGITILAKNTAINWKDHRINIIDTPGHADFGGEVERVLSMVDSVLLLVDAVDGPMPQTRYVTQKAFELGLKPILVINKVDRPEARPHWVLDQVFELFDNLGATDEQLDFNVIYASALNGLAGLEADDLAEDMTPLLDMIIDKVSAPNVDEEAPFSLGSLLKLLKVFFDSLISVSPATNSLFFKSKNPFLKKRLFFNPFELFISSLKYTLLALSNSSSIFNVNFSNSNKFFEFCIIFVL